MTEELAAALATEEGLRVARELEAAGLLAPPRDALPAARPPASEPRPISIWQPVGEGAELCWVRPPSGPFGDHYAAREVLLPRRGLRPRRICFFGESVAAGYLYAPHLTPAGVLAAKLEAAAGPGEFEVLDLARTNETLTTLRATVEASLQLTPDLLVMFAGNNWNLLEMPRCSPFAPRVEDRRGYAEAVASGGLAAPRELAARELLGRFWTFAEKLAALRTEAGCEVMWVIPEVNLADWPHRQPVAWLAGGGAAAWYEALAEARAALAAGDLGRAEAAAWCMIELDGETCPTPCQLLVEVFLRRGDCARAALAARAAVDADASATAAGLSAPRASSFAQGLIERAAAEFGFRSVDLRRELAAPSGGSLPGRDLFLDYCHLNARGIDLAMSAVARQVLAWGGFAAAAELRAVSPAPAVEATAWLGAAMHTAHRLLPEGELRPRLRELCRTALAADPGVASAMLDLATARLSPVPAVLSRAQGPNLASPYRLSLQHGWRWDEVDAELLLALEEALAEDQPAAADELRKLLADSWMMRAPRLELSRSPFLWQPLERFLPDLLPAADLPGRAFLRCPSPEATFCLPWWSGELTLEFILRLPAIGGEPPQVSQVTVQVGEGRLAELEVGAAWHRVRLPVPPELLRPGLNRLTLRWPPLPAVDEHALAWFCSRQELGREADLFPVFGEVYAVTALR